MCLPLAVRCKKLLERFLDPCLCASPPLTQVHAGTLLDRKSGQYNGFQTWPIGAKEKWENPQTRSKTIPGGSWRSEASPGIDFFQAYGSLGQVRTTCSRLKISRVLPCPLWPNGSSLRSLSSEVAIFTLMSFFNRETPGSKFISTCQISGMNSSTIKYRGVV